MKKSLKSKTWNGLQLEKLNLGKTIGGGTNGHTYISQPGGGEFDDCTTHKQKPEQQ